MGGGGSILRISFGLMLVTSTILLGIDLMGWIPRVESRDTELRINVAETLAAQATGASETGDLRSVRTSLRVAVDRVDGLLSAGVRSVSGPLVVSVGNHRELWNPEEPDRSTPTHIRVPVYRDGEHWGTVELRFEEPAGGGGLSSLWKDSNLRVVIAVAVLGFISYAFYMRRTLRYLDPSAVIPARVQATLDVMTEGVVVIDASGDIVLANAAFAERLGLQPSDLMGRKASSCGWRDRDGREITGALPWTRAMEDGDAFVGESLSLNRSARDRVLLAVNGAPVLDGWGRPTGAIVTFDDVTEIEKNRLQLQQALDELEKSRDEIRMQNEELQELARRDPLTGVANRRSFMDDVAPIFEQACAEGGELSCLMVDIDHFKRVNDEHGHQTGDEVIRRVADGLVSQVGGRGIVCRYGGEEFCVAIPTSAVDEAEALGERIRRHIDSPGFASVQVTASIGVSSVRDGSESLAALIDQADQALYHSKETGRNRLTRFDRMPDGAG